MRRKFTPCECDEPGWCARHQCEKSALWQRFCETDPAMFAAWELGRGPGQGKYGHEWRAACAYLGEVLREETCRSCRGNVRIKVFACDIHGECALSLKSVSAAICAECEDYVVPERVTGN